MNAQQIQRRRAVWRTMVGVAAAVAAAGCGGGSDDVTPAVTPPAVTPSPPSPTVAANCPPFTSGTLRLIEPRSDAGGIDALTGTATVDAAALTVSDDAGATTLTAAGTCRYTADGGNSDFTVSSGGFVVGRSRAGAAHRLTLAFPEQTVPLADLAGTWNVLAFERTGDATGTYLAEGGTITLDAAGAFTERTLCPGVTACLPTETANLPSLTVRAGGGFDLRPADLSYTDRAFAYRNGTAMVLVVLAGNGSFGIWTRQQALPLPIVGVEYVNVSYAVDPTLNAIAPNLNQQQVESLDAAASRYTRISHTVGDTDHHRETVTINTPRTGYAVRTGATQEPVLDGTPPTVVVQPFTSLGVNGMGMTVLHLPVPGRFMLSVMSPAQP